MKLPEPTAPINDLLTNLLAQAEEAAAASIETRDPTEKLIMSREAYQLAMIAHQLRDAMDTAEEQVAELIDAVRSPESPYLPVPNSIIGTRQKNTPPDGEECGALGPRIGNIISRCTLYRVDCVAPAPHLFTVDNVVVASYR